MACINKHRDACAKILQARIRSLKTLQKLMRSEEVVCFPSVRPRDMEIKAKHYLQKNIGMKRGVILYCAALVRAVYKKGNKNKPWALGYFEGRVRFLARCVRDCHTPGQAASVIMDKSDKRIHPFANYEIQTGLSSQYQ